VRNREYPEYLALLKSAALLTMIALAAISLSACGQNAQTGSDGSKAEGGKSEPSKEDAVVQSAMSAAPMAIAKDAAIVDYPTQAGEPLIDVRKGTNGWTCSPTGKPRQATIPSAWTRRG
jgi:hypothetical protein